MDVLPTLRRAAGAAFDLVAPPRCLACEAEEATWAGLGPACLRLVRPVPPAPCRVCGAALGPGAPADACLSCAKLRPRFAATVAGAAYAGLGGELVRRAKYGRDVLFALPLAALLQAAFDRRRDAFPVDVVIAVPSTPRRMRERGFNLAERIAEPLARGLARPCEPRRLVRVGEPPPQAALSRAERRRAAAGTVRVRPASVWFRVFPSASRSLAGRHVLLVDDVLTTGATANACTRALLGAGARDVSVAVATRA